MLIKKTFQIKRTVLEMRRLVMWRKVKLVSRMIWMAYFGIRDEVCSLSQGCTVEHVYMLYFEAQHFEESKKWVPCNNLVCRMIYYGKLLIYDCAYCEWCWWRENKGLAGLGGKL